MSGPPSHAETLGRYAGAFVDELAAAGIDDVCLCPGSRSTPLAMTFERHPGVRTWMHLDERSCAYFALGMAKASGRAVAILCSSGTAAVNFAPAVVEAYHAHVPLIVLTADRPPELQDLGANQTIDQVDLYGSAVKWSSQMPLPEASEAMLRYARAVAVRAVATAQAAPRGPVHVNLPFREPLVPAPAVFSAHRAGRQAWAPAATAPPTTLVDDLLAARRPVVVCGAESGLGLRDIERLAEALQAPVLADPVSGVRGAADVIGAHDCFLRDPVVARALRPDYVLRFGAPPTGRPLAAYLQAHRDVCQVQVAAPGEWPDPDLNAHQIVEADPAAVCAAIAMGKGSAEPAWLAAWQRIEAATETAIRCALAEDEATEPSAVVDLAAVLPGGATVIAGNSMPIRDFDSFWPAGAAAAAILGNRGASGIDGVVSTALGASAVSEGATVLVIGDLSFYHDMNGLLAARRFGLDATIVLINNDGGGIFSFLPQHDDAELFEALWGTPHGLDFSHVAGLYGVDFQRVTTRAEYRSAVEASFEKKGVQVIEVRTDREENLRLHQRIWDEVATAVKGVELP